MRVDEWMSGWRPFSSVCGMAVGCAAAVLPGAVVWLVPYSSHCSASEYCCHVVHRSLLGVRVVGGGCVSVLFVWWGILCALPPRRGGGWGRRGWWAGIADGGWHGERRAVVLLTPRLLLVSPSFSIGVPSLVRSVAVLKGGGCVCYVAPVSCCPRSLHDVPCLRIRPVSCIV